MTIKFVVLTIVSKKKKQQFLHNSWRNFFGKMDTNQI